MARSFRRRSAILSTVSLLAILAAGRVSARTIAHQVPWNPGETDVPDGISDGPWEFFTEEEAAFVDAAVARLIPSDELGPGAREAGVTIFLDRQLAGRYGRAERWYMHGPWSAGTESQGYQSRLAPAELYRTAIKAIDDHCRHTFAGQTFSALAPEQQDSVLRDLERGKVKIARTGPSPVEIEGADDSFVAVLLQNTIEGFFGDPLYGGNRDMLGWKLIGFPGAHYDYRPYVSQHGRRLAIEPVGLRGRPGWDFDRRTEEDAQWRRSFQRWTPYSWGSVGPGR